MLRHHFVSCVLLVAFHGVSAIELLAEQPDQKISERNGNQRPASPDDGENFEPRARQDEAKLSPKELLERMFAKLAPPVGSALPDVTALDADGQLFPLSRMQGDYSVIVFGCLT